jgi:uncharacterized protein (DUF1697 family)
MTDTHVALLRGINVGGHNKLPMKDLAAVFTDLGCDDVRTYIQSGNVVFTARTDLAAEIPVQVPAAIEDRFSLKVPVMTRSAVELRDAARANPFLAEDLDPKTLAVAFLAEVPDPARVARLDPDRSPPDRFAVVGREVYLHLPNGVARSKLTNAYLDSTLATISTARNLRTVSKLLEMAEEHHRNQDPTRRDRGRRRP